MPGPHLPPSKLAKFAVQKGTNFLGSATKGRLDISVSMGDDLRLHAFRTRLDGAANIIIATLGAVDIDQMHLDARQTTCQMPQSRNNCIFGHFG